MAETHKFAHRHRRRFPDLPVAMEGDDASTVDIVNRIRETLLIMLGDKDRADRFVNYEDLSFLGLVDPRNYLPRAQAFGGIPHGRLSGNLNATVVKNIWASLSFGTIDVKNERLFKSDGSGLEIRVSGEYLFAFYMAVPAYVSSTDTNYNVSIRLRINGAGGYRFGQVMTNEQGTIRFTPMSIYTFAADDIITFEFTHNNNNNLAIDQDYTLSVMQLNPDPVQAWARGIKQP